MPLKLGASFTAMGCSFPGGKKDAIIIVVVVVVVCKFVFKIPCYVKLIIVQ